MKVYRVKKYLFFVFSLLFLMQFSVSVQAAYVTDPIGDFDSPDITSITSEVKDGYLYIKLDFAESLEGKNCAGGVFLDTDKNPNTGYNEGSGADYVYTYNVISIIYSDPIVSAILNDNIVNENTLSISGSQLFISIPLSMLGNDEGDMDIFVASHSGISAFFFDRTPDYGVLNTITGELSIPVQAENLEGSFQDKAGDSFGSTDITGIETRVHDGVFDIQLTYKNNVESDDVHGWILIDSDQSIATGFTNTGEVPPSFGVDYRLEYTIGSMLGTQASMTAKNGEPDSMGYMAERGIPIGMPYNDAMFLVSGNLVVFRLPLGLLDFDDGKVSLVVNSFPVRDVSGEMEQVPELEEGALDTGTGEIRHLLTYTENPIEITDPAGDSTGFGYDGDDLTSVEIGYSDNIMLLTITYTELKITDGAITTVFFDTDQSAEKFSEYTFMYSFYNGLLGAQIFGNMDGTYGMRNAKHLISRKGNRMYLSIPLESLKDEGNMDIYIETALVPSTAKIPARKLEGAVDITPDKFNRNIYDRAPDIGSISISKQGSVYQNKNLYATSGDDVVIMEAEDERQNPESPGFGYLLAVFSLLAGVFSSKFKQLWQ